MEEPSLNDGPGVSISIFDYSIENHFKAMDTISKLCEEFKIDGLNETDIQRFSSSITFLREWRHFNYEPRIIRFASELRDSPGKGVSDVINLPQFSSATVPKQEGLCGSNAPPESSKDFVMYVGGSVWALDWCPRVHENPNRPVKCEFIAVATHPPESYYHKMGTPLTGRGIIQIWCVLNVGVNEEEDPLSKKKPKRGFQSTEAVEESSLKRPRGRPRKKPLDESQTDRVKRPRGRPRNKSIGEPLNSDQNDEPFQPLDVQYPEGSFEPVSIDNTPGNMQENVPDKNHQIRKCSSNSFEVSPGSSIPGDIALPRAVLCLAHNGKVAWDVKWKPYDINDSKFNQRMGYLAVLLGNGSLEVWEVPLPNMIRNVYSLSPKQGTDPRFVKLEPVLKCSKLKCGDIQSIPLTVEWSTSSPHDYLLAGCHDGMVALWKFSASDTPKDTRPLLCFSADSVPIRSVAWAPSGSDMESRNVILTAGHGGLKFWDIRDPFLPLWDVHPAPKFIYSLDWLPEPRCVILSFDDGTMKMLSLVHAACDVPVTGKPFTGTKQQGLHLYNCSSFAIWSVQVSRLTGMVAYCGADGTVTRFQLTSKAVDKDFSRHRTPHFPCGSLTEEESAVIVNTPLPDIPVTLKKPSNDYGEGPRSMRAFLTESNQGKNAKDRKAKVAASNKQTLALYYGNDPGVESESEETLAALQSKRKQKSNGKKKADDDQVLAIRIEEPTNTQKEETGNEIEVFPPKIVAMHRVRWNMNKGSERWLCYGGAAGIVRCQEIIVPDVDKKSARKS
ncbi:uncharacterized protein LOC111310200 isoform X2 [Durio zibethinus]|uniref:Uncharacterized protein LOC111310200 isoform X2 n=1 Tax=Durio zibethinus TaxID=66656 RepID=A0A6P6AJZ3_DURZI|nr:uncharacterized protein LOC111310200 isoform X2 [Durio zibethinus]